MDCTSCKAYRHTRTRLLARRSAPHSETSVAAMAYPTVFYLSIIPGPSRFHNFTLCYTYGSTEEVRAMEHAVRKAFPWEFFRRGARWVAVHRPLTLVCDDAACQLVAAVATALKSCGLLKLPWEDLRCAACRGRICAALL